MSVFHMPYEGRPRVQVKFTKPSMTKQSFKAECDINNILRKYKKNMGRDFLSAYSGYLDGKFGDVSAGTDYQTALAQIMQARAAFEAMPANLRSRFDNDPGRFMEFMSDSKNKDEALTLGLLKPEVKPARAAGSNIPVPLAG